MDELFHRDTDNEWEDEDGGDKVHISGEKCTSLKGSICQRTLIGEGGR